jgi:hypothetical protein
MRSAYTPRTNLASKSWTLIRFIYILQKRPFCWAVRLCNMWFNQYQSNTPRTEKWRWKGRKMGTRPLLRIQFGHWLKNRSETWNCKIFLIFILRIDSNHKGDNGKIFLIFILRIDSYHKGDNVCCFQSAPVLKYWHSAAIQSRRMLISCQIADRYQFASLHQNRLSHLHPRVPKTSIILRYLCGGLVRNK